MKILVVAGEASADLHAAEVIAELKKTLPIELIGIGGDHLQALGLEPIAHAKEMGVVGLTEAISRIPVSLRLMRELGVLAEKHRPQLALLVDLPDFNLRLAPDLKSLGIPVVYYVSPQVWAWRSGRVQQMAKVLDRLLCILPFEKAWYEKNAPKNLRVEYVGHPVIEEIPDLPYAPDPYQIALLPGSRVRELTSLLPTMLEAAVLLRQQEPRLKFVLPLAPTLRNSAEIRELLRASGSNATAIKILGDSFSVVHESAAEVLRRAKVAVVASGTATLETAIVGTPMVVLYKVSTVSAFLFRHFISYRGPVAMANIIHVGITSDERICPELLQEDVRPERLFEEVHQLLVDNSRWQKQAAKLQQTRSLLQVSPSPIVAVANVLKEYNA